MRISIGIDAAKEVHWATAVTQDGRALLDRKVLNTAEDIGTLAAESATLGGERLVGIDLLGGMAALLSAMLLAAGERLAHVPGWPSTAPVKAASAARPEATQGRARHRRPTPPARRRLPPRRRAR